jgi:hypothetical protein
MADYKTQGSTYDAAALDLHVGALIVTLKISFHKDTVDAPVILSRVQSLHHPGPSPARSRSRIEVSQRPMRPQTCYLTNRLIIAQLAASMDFTELRTNQFKPCCYGFISERRSLEELTVDETKVP